MKTMNALQVVDAISMAQKMTFAVEFETTRYNVSGSSCDYCGGTGERECSHCGGSGEVTTYYLPDHTSYRYAERYDFIELGTEQCPECDGEGTLECDECDGHASGSDSLAFDWEQVKDEHCGSELVTGIMSWEDWNESRTELDRDLLAVVNVDSSTGGHTHVDFTRIVELGAGPRTLANVAIMIHMLNDSIHTRLNINERRARGTFARAYNAENKGFGDYHSSDVWDFVNTQIRLFNDNQMNYNERYRWLNLRNVKPTTDYNYKYKNTLEFRVFDSTDDLRQAERNIAIAQAFTAYAYTVAQSDLLSLTADDLWNEITELADRILASVIPDEYSFNEDSEQIILSDIVE